jgi:hypothetical protein
MTEMQFKPIPQLSQPLRLLGLVLIAIWCSVACGIKAGLGEQDDYRLDELLRLVVVSEVRKPEGNEIQVRLTVTGPKQARVVVENVSGVYVYLPYLPGIADERHAAYVILGLEKKNPVSGDFEDVEESHFGPGSNSLAPGEWFAYDFSVLDSGQFRVNIRYIIDKEWSDRSNRLPFLKREDILLHLEEFDRLVDELVGTVTAGPVGL